MKKWQLTAASVALIMLPNALQSVAANDKFKEDDRDKLGMSSITVPGKQHRLTTSLQITTVVEPNIRQTPTPCAAELDMTYYQKDSVAEVATGITSNTCPDHQGRFLLRVLYKTGQGETQRLEHEAQWSSAAGKDRVTENFPLGENAELMRVNATIIQCECALQSAPNDSATK